MRLLKESVLTMGAILGVLCVVAGIAASAFGVTPLVFRSGSMSPAIETGSLALAHTVPATAVRVGDIVSVDRFDGSRITHRVDAIGAVTGQSVVLRLKGDANAAADSEPYVVGTADVVFAHVPYAGYFVAWLSTPFAWICGLIFSAALIAVAWRPTLPKPAAGRHAVAASVALVAVSTTVIGFGFSRSDNTAAALSDTASATSTITAATLTAPATFTCTNTLAGLSVASLTWPNANKNFGYQLVFTSTATSATRTVPIAASAAATVSYNPVGLSLAAGTATVTLQTTYGQFISATSLSRTITYTTGLLASCVTAGSTSAAAPAAQRQANVVAPTTAAPTTTSAAPTTTSGSPTTTSAAPTTTPPITTTDPITTTVSTTTAPTTTAAPTTTLAPTTTQPPPPKSAFAAPGSPSTSPSGANVASIADGKLLVTDSTGATVYSRPVTTSDRYGYGVTWSSNGDLWVLSEIADPLKLTPASDGSFAAESVTPSAVPSDIAALL